MHFDKTKSLNSESARAKGVEGGWRWSRGGRRLHPARSLSLNVHQLLSSHAPVFPCAGLTDPQGSARSPAHELDRPLSASSRRNHVGFAAFTCDHSLWGGVFGQIEALIWPDAPVEGVAVSRAPRLCFADVISLTPSGCRESTYEIVLSF